LADPLPGDVEAGCKVALAGPYHRVLVTGTIPAEECLKDRLLRPAFLTAPDISDLLGDQVHAGVGVRSGFVVLGSGLDCLGRVELDIGQAVAEQADEFAQLSAGLVPDSTKMQYLS